jgi:hypothetical protein
VVKSGGIITPVMMSVLAALKALICAEVVSVLVAARIGELVAELGEHRREADVGVAPGIAVAVIGEEPTDAPVGIELRPHVGEDGDDILETPEEVIGVVERLPGAGIAGVALLADKPWLPRRHRRQAWNAFGFAGGRDRVGCLRRRGDHHQVDLVVDDQLLGDRGGAVRIGLAVLDDDLVVQPHPLGGILEAGDDEVVGFGEGRQRSRLRADITELDRLVLGYGGHGKTGRAGEHGGCRGILQQCASGNHLTSLPVCESQVCGRLPSQAA